MKLPRPPGRSPQCWAQYSIIGLNTCGSELARELPGTGSKASACGTSGIVEVACFRGPSQLS
ncbi:hypothetical protein BW686_22925 [Pseudomonas syringae]|uniref:Uncharacterized protein n=1 Tax=Pseudomonas syringae TaxID=317 RepID=A0A244EL12_PSESX|nr:hypothetical protein BW686_22925 [Pseudomonas syringae]